MTAVLLSTTVLAALIVLAGWILMAVGAVILMNKKIDPGVADTTGGERFLYYGLSLMFWPAGLVLAFKLLGAPESARTGRNCGLMVIAVFTACVLIACGITVGAAVWVPENL